MIAMKWVLGFVWALYIIFQIVAIKHLRGGLRKRCLIVLRFMVIAILLANGVQLIFESATEKRIEFLLMVALGIVAIAALARLFALEKHQGLLKADS
jgi:uncharacterized membrane protein